jgi:hypothetical protein
LNTYNHTKKNEDQPISNSHAKPLVTGKSALQFQDNRSRSIIQKKNSTGLPDQLKSGIENLSGHSMDDVKVHYNSDKPAQLSAHAYAQGTDIHIAPGQEKHLPHEAWHVVQQKQGRVKPTVQMKRKVNVNDDKRLEDEADTMGAKAVQLRNVDKGHQQKKMPARSESSLYQFVVVSDKVEKKIDKWAGDKAELVKGWFDDAVLLSEGDVVLALDVKFSTWWSKFEKMDAKIVTPEMLHGGSAKPAKVVNPLVQVAAKITAEGLSPALFTSVDKTTINDMVKGGSSWSDSIRAVNTTRIARVEKQARVAKFAGVKAAGDLIFTAGLLKAVWDYSYDIAITGAVPVNATLGAEYTDAVILPAAATWSGRVTVVPGVVAAGSASVTNMHVPNAPVYIEDKSIRLVNPDPTRNRQACFISTWDASVINIHVNSTQHH